MFQDSWIHDLYVPGCEFASKDIIDYKANVCIVKAFSEKKKKHVAIKFINVTHLCEERLLTHSKKLVYDKVIQEAKIHRKFDHPNIVHLYDYDWVIGSIDRIFYLVMEYISGKTLLAYLNKHGKISEIETSGYFKQILKATQYIHEQGIVHRDLKLENIMLTDTYNIVILDFGLSHVSGSYLQTSCGSPAYAAPEIWKGINYDGTLVDVYALGVILYAMVTGTFPLFDNNIQVLCHKVKYIKPEIPSHISNNLQRLLQDMLVKSPKRRISLEEIYDRTWIRSPPHLWCTDYSCSQDRHNCFSKSQSWGQCQNSPKWNYSPDTSPRAKVEPLVPPLNLSVLTLSKSLRRKQRLNHSAHGKHRRKSKTPTPKSSLSNSERREG